VKCYSGDDTEGGILWESSTVPRLYFFCIVNTKHNFLNYHHTMNYAIIEASGRQFWVEPGRFYDFNHLDLHSGDKIALTRVLLVNNEGNVSVGHPCLENAKVEATVLGHIHSRKVTVYKMRPKKKTRKKQGYRSDLTRVMINSIQFEGATIE
jgi:large subunit ribosomal protein L21